MSSLRVLICGLALIVAPPSLAQVPLELRPRPSGPYEIRGVVVDAGTGQPLPEVELSFQESAQPTSPPFEIIQSDANGTFRVRNLAEGKYTIRASRQGYAEQAFLQHENYWTGIAVGPGKDSLHVRFPLSPSAIITGQVTDENGEAVREATVTLWVHQMENGVRTVTQGQTAQADDEGRYRLEHLQPGEYSLSVTAMPWYSRYMQSQQPKEGVLAPLAREAQEALPDVVYATLYYPNTRDWHGMGWIKLQAGQTESADFKLIPEPSAHLQVQTGPSDTQPSSNFELMTELPGGGRSNVMYRGLRTGAGTMEISGVPAGRYRIQMGSGGGNEKETEQEVELSADSQLRLDGPTTGGLAIRGVIRVAPGAPKIEQAMLQLKDAEGHSYNSIFYEASGNADNPSATFVFSNVPSGQVLRLSFLQPQDAVVKKIEAKGAEVSGTTIETDGSQEVSLTVTVAQVSNTLDGTAIKQGKPFAGAMILLMPEDGKDWERFMRRDQSDSDGTFHLATILPGKYVLFALENGWYMEWSKPEVLQPFLAKAQKLQVGEQPLSAVTLEVQ